MEKRFEKKVKNPKTGRTKTVKYGQAGKAADGHGINHGRRSAMSRTHDVTISAFDLDRLEAELAAVTEQRDMLAEEIENLKSNLTWNITEQINESEPK
jgi:hypothetical protein